MKNRPKIQHEVKETLSSLDSIRRATANPYLFTGIKARLESEEKSFWIIAFSLINKPAVAISAVVIIILINAILLFEFRSEPTQTTQESEQVFASEYNLSANTIYDSTIEQQ